MLDGDVICFNTQPPEGGWKVKVSSFQSSRWFQHTAARRRLAFEPTVRVASVMFQHTAARRRLEGILK